MDIRQLIEEKPMLGKLVEARFGILHNLRKLKELEPEVYEVLKAGGPLRVATKENTFLLKADENAQVEMELHRCHLPETVRFFDVPYPVQLFCNEAVILHNNQTIFQQLTDSEIFHIKEEFQSYGVDELHVTKGKFCVRVVLQGNELVFEQLQAICLESEKSSII